MTSKVEMNRKDKVFEALIKIAAEEVLVEEMENEPSPEELNQINSPSPELDRRIRSMIAEGRKLHKRKQTAKMFTKIAAAFGIFFTIGTIILMSVEASRNFILNTFISIQSDHIGFEFGGNANAPNDVVLPDSLPFGFELVNLQETSVSILGSYSNTYGEYINIRVLISPVAGIFIDNTDIEFYIITLFEQEIFVISAIDAYDDNIVMWNDGANVTSLISTTDINTLKVIAEFLLEN